MSYDEYFVMIFFLYFKRKVTVPTAACMLQYNSCVLNRISCTNKWRLDGWSRS
jgi:hypothetical protein